jgi:hypothetical protein
VASCSSERLCRGCSSYDKRSCRDVSALVHCQRNCGETVDVLLDFTDHVINGLSVFHCHLLNHDDKGMTAKILFK